MKHNVVVLAVVVVVVVADKHLEVSPYLFPPTSTKFASGNRGNERHKMFSKLRSSIRDTQLHFP